jgi:hypothetical protein
MESHPALPSPHLPASWSLPSGGLAPEPLAGVREDAAELRARLLKLIVANETSRHSSHADALKPR